MENLEQLIISPEEALRLESTGYLVKRSSPDTAPIPISLSEITDEVLEEAVFCALSLRLTPYQLEMLKYGLNYWVQHERGIAQHEGRKHRKEKP